MKNKLKLCLKGILAIGTAYLAVTIFQFTSVNQSAQVLKVPGEKYTRYSSPDEITGKLRSTDNEIIIVHKSDRDEFSGIEGTSVVADYPDYSVMIIAKSLLTIELLARVNPLDTKISLPGTSFEPIGFKPVTDSGSAHTDKSGRKYYVVQFGFPADDSLLDSIRDTGTEIVQHVPSNAFLVYADENSAGKLQQHNRVRWVGEYTLNQKLSQQTIDAANSLNGGKGLFDITVLKTGDFLNEYETVRGLSSKIVSTEKPPAGYFDLITAELNRSQMDEISKLTHVFRIDPFVEPVAEDERAAQIVSGNYLNTTTINAPGYDPLSQFGADGANVTVSISDDGVTIPGNGGFYLTGANTIDGPLRGTTAGADGGHGHINASIVAGSTPFGVLDPTGYNYGRGIAPAAHIINIPFLKTGNTTTDLESVSDTVSTAGPNGVNGSIINNSWGAGTNGNAYDSRAALWDTFAFDASIAATVDPINVVFSAGNSGTSGLTRPKVAKNVIAVGNSENLRTEISATGANNIDDMRSSSSRGPAGDGRVKPDITAPGSYIAGSRGGSGSSVSGQIDTNHSYSIGTSHSAPQIAGVAALFTQYWKTNNSGMLPKPSLVKAAILNTGLEMNGVGSSNPLPNGDEGWGRVNVGTMLNTGVPMMHKNETTEFSSPGISTIFNGSVGDASKPVRIALVWSDPPGTVDPALVNNLDLTVTIGANIYKGNVLVNGSSVTGGSFDTLNNVEMVRLPAGLSAGTSVEIQVGAVTLNGDGIPGNADTTDQTFSLVTYNVGTPVAPTGTTRFDFDGDRKTDASIFRPSAGQWWYLRSSDFGNRGFAFGTSGDKLAPADYTGDGKTDIALFRNGEWFVLRSEDNSFYSVPFGTTGDIPAPGDFDGDGKADTAVYRQSDNFWYIQQSSGGTIFQQFGVTEDIPIVEDYDGDGKDDIAVFRPSVSQWWLLRSTAGVIGYQFGSTGDKTVQGDYTGDGKADVALFRPANNNWYILRSEDSSFYSVPFGAAGDIPTAGDYDGDGKTDTAVYRPSDNFWYVQGTTSGFFQVLFGTAGDVPVPAVYNAP